MQQNSCVGKRFLFWISWTLWLCAESSIIRQSALDVPDSSTPEGNFPALNQPSWPFVMDKLWIWNKQVSMNGRSCINLQIAVGASEAMPYFVERQCNLILHSLQENQFLHDTFDHKDNTSRQSQRVLVRSQPALQWRTQLAVRLPKWWQRTFVQSSNERFLRSVMLSSMQSTFSVSGALQSFSHGDPCTSQREEQLLYLTTLFEHFDATCASWKTFASTRMAKSLFVLWFTTGIPWHILCLCGMFPSETFRHREEIYADRWSTKHHHLRSHLPHTNKNADWNQLFTYPHTHTRPNSPETHTQPLLHEKREPSSMEELFLLAYKTRFSPRRNPHACAI